MAEPISQNERVSISNGDQDPVFDEAFIRGGRPEPSAQERADKARRIAQEHERLERAGEIASGTGKPAFRQRQRRSVFLGLAVGLAVLIVVVAVIVSR